MIRFLFILLIIKNISVMGATYGDFPVPKDFFYIMAGILGLSEVCVASKEAGVTGDDMEKAKELHIKICMINSNGIIKMEDKPIVKEALFLLDKYNSKSSLTDDKAKNFDWNILGMQCGIF